MVERVTNPCTNITRHNRIDAGVIFSKAVLECREAEEANVERMQFTANTGTVQRKPYVSTARVECHKQTTSI